MLKILKLSLLLITLTLVSCQTFKVVEPDELTKLGNIKIKTERQWSQYNSLDKTRKYLTRDGVLLNGIIVTNVKDGQHIYKYKLTEFNKGFNFNKKMSLEEASELYIDGLNASNVQNVNIINESLYEVIDSESMKVEFSYDTEFGLKYRHIVLIILHDDQLDILNVYAPVEHYFPMLEDEFNGIIQSAKISDN